MNSENLATILALVGGIAAATATIVTAVKKVGEGNYATAVRRIENLEQLTGRQNTIIVHLSNWQVDARELIRMAANQILSLGGHWTDEMRTLQHRLDREISVEKILQDEDAK